MVPAILTKTGPDHPWGWWGWSLRARNARYNENLQSRTTLGKERNSYDYVWWTSRNALSLMAIQSNL